MHEHQRRSISQTFLLDLVTGLLRTHRPTASPETTRIVDIGGGTGIIATALGELGYRVLVVDPSPDALASLERRSRERHVEALVHGVQGDTGDLATAIGDDPVDVVVCHRVLEVVDSPAEALAAIAAVLAPGGLLSLVVTQGPAAVLAQGLAGHFAQARRTAVDPRRLTYSRTVDLVAGAGLRVLDTHGVGAISDHVPEALVDAGGDAYAELLALEHELSQDPVFRPIAPQLHVLAMRDEQ